MIQFALPYAFLGFLTAKQIHPLSFTLTSKTHHSLTELKQLCGTVNWLKLFQNMKCYAFPLYWKGLAAHLQKYS